MSWKTNKNVLSKNSAGLPIPDLKLDLTKMLGFFMITDFS